MLIAAKDVRPGVWRKMANVLHRENKNKDLEKMQKNMENMQEEVNRLTTDIKWLQESRMQEKVYELKEKMKELDQDEVSPPGRDNHAESELDEALKSYVNGGAPEGSQQDKDLQKFEADAYEQWKRDKAHFPRKQDNSYQAEIKNQYIV